MDNGFMLGEIYVSRSASQHLSRTDSEHLVEQHVREGVQSVAATGSHRNIVTEQHASDGASIVIVTSGDGAATYLLTPDEVETLL